jgi:peptide/nickel transport system substrate-binding protein/oligopeptide transport system substrate-binding protein
MRVKTWLVIGLVFMLGWPAVSFGQQPKSGGTFRWSMSGDLQAGGLDPAKFTDYNGWAIGMDIYNGLVQFDEKNAIAPDLAERWTVSANSKVYTFFLRRGVKFTNGRELTAQDFKYSIERIMDPATKSPNTWIFEDVIAGATAMMKGEAKEIAGIRVRGPYEVQITLEQPLGHFLALLTMPQAFVLAREEVERWGADYVSHPVGTGPFILEEWRRQDRIILKANPTYFAGKPYIERQEIRVIPESSTAEAEFKTGRLDVLGIPDATFRQWVSDPQWKPHIITGAGLNIQYLAFNLRRRPFNDVRVRRAVAYAIPRKQILESIFNGRGIIAHGPIPPSLPGYSTKIAALPYDPAKAKALLREAGYPDGLEVELLLTPTTNNRRLFDVLEASLRGVGITLRPGFRERAVYFRERGAGSFAVARADWIADYLDAENFLYPLFHTASRHFSGYTNPKVDQLIDAARATVDPAQRVRRYQEAEAAIIADMPWVFMWHSVGSTVYQPWVMGETYDATPRRTVKIWLNR